MSAYMLTSAEHSFRLLNMSSAAAPASPGHGPGGPDRDLTARARIRDAAIARFAADGVAGTSVRAIAEEAGVSPPLVMHHFGSKDRLRLACDEHVAATIRERKTAAAAAGQGLDPLQALRDHDRGGPILRYLARTLGDGSPHVSELVDELVADAEVYMAEGVRTGLLKPTDHPRGRAAVLTLWSLGALVLHEHLFRILGVDLAGGADRLGGYALPATEILEKGVLSDGLYERVAQAYAAVDPEATPAQDPSRVTGTEQQEGS
jgi:AcrR family transcriptional regulator